MKALIAGLIWLGGSFAFAQVPDPRDSIILESKTVAPGAHPGSAMDTAAYVYLKVYITNKDTLYVLALPLQETSISGGAYAILGRPRNFNGTVNNLTNTLISQRVTNLSHYNSSSPDSFLFGGLFDPQFQDVEPPNSVRKPFWEIKFDSVSSVGTVELDSVTFLGNKPVFAVDLYTPNPRDLPVNFVKSVITVAYPKGDLSQNNALSPADVVWILNCVMLGTVPPAGMAACDLNCDGQASPADVVLELNTVFLAQPLPC